jgi:hypothetical protein
MGDLFVENEPEKNQVRHSASPGDRGNGGDSASVYPWGRAAPNLLSAPGARQGAKNHLSVQLSPIGGTQARDSGGVKRRRKLELG